MEHSFIDVLVACLLATIMFGVGISISYHDVKAVFAKPKAFLVAITSQMVLLPLIAFGIASFFATDPVIQVGLVILAASPGGATSGFITFLFRGNTALSITLTSINSFLTLFSIPIIVNIALLLYMRKSEAIVLPFWNTVTEIFFITICPATLGISVRLWRSVFAERISRYLKPVLSLLLLIVFTIKIVGSEKHGEAGISINEILYLFPFCFLLNILCFCLGYGITWFFKLKHRDRLTTAIESAVHNTTLAFLIAGTLLRNTDLCKPALVYAMFSFWTALIYCFIIQQYGKGSIRKDSNLTILKN